MHKSFSFKGINRNSDILLAQDGECLDVVNMRMLNGSLSPVPKPSKITRLNVRYSALFWHEMAGCYIALTGDDSATLHFYDSEWKPFLSGASMLSFSQLRNVQRVEFLGNIVICIAREGIYYLLFEHGTYRWLGERPDIPETDVSVVSKLQYVISENGYYMMSATDDLESTWNYNEKGYIEECVSALNKDCHYIDRAMFRIALRLYDGSYINCSNIIYVSDETYSDGVGRDANNMHSEPMTSESLSKYRVSVRGFKPEFTFDTSGLDAWKNIVVGIDVFSTVSIPGKKCELTGRTSRYERYIVKPIEELWNEVAGASLYYKVAEYGIDGKLQYRVDDVSAVNLALQQGLDTSVMPSSYSGICAGCSYVYNGRLHIASLREYLFKGYDVAALAPVSSAKRAVDAVSVQTKIRTTQGDFIVENYSDAPLLGHDGYDYELSPLLTYPDARAFEMTLYVVIGGVVRKKVFPLTAHKYLNVAYYLHKGYKPYSVTQESFFANGGKSAKASDDTVLRIFNYTPGVYEVIYSTSMQSWTYNGNNFPPDEYQGQRAFAVPRNIADGDKLVYTIKREAGSLEFTDIGNIIIDNAWETVDRIDKVDELPFEERPNVIKVAMPDNPFVFPASSTYMPSQSKVVAMSSNTTALSQGQFGQFPLYIFCSDGIWAMSVDTSGTMAYLSCHPLSRDVCVDENTICGIAGGIIFGGKQGMMLLVGNSMKKISSAMDCLDRSTLVVEDSILLEIASLVSLSHSMVDDVFENFLRNATVTYLPTHNELLISNSSYGYSYLFSLDTGFWSRLSCKFSGKVCGTSQILLYERRNDTTIIYSFSERNSGDNRVLLYTRPQLWGTKLYKRVMQLLLHASVAPPQSPTEGMPMLACYMLGSNDGVHFRIIAGSENMNRTKDLLFPYFPTQSYKYYLFAVVGDMGEISVITGMELDVNVTWNNRLR